MMGLVDRDDGWRMPDWLWERIEPLLPIAPEHPLGYTPRGLPEREAMDAILLVLRTGMQWNALNVDRGVSTPLRRTGAFRSGSRPASSMRSGARGCSTTTSRSVSTGRWSGGRRSDDQSAARRAQDWSRIPLTGPRGGEALAPRRGCGRPDRARSRRR